MPQRIRLIRLLESAESSSVAQLQALSGQLATFPPADLAFILEELGEERGIFLFRSLETELAAEVLVEFSEEFLKDLFPSVSLRYLASLVNLLQPDDAADIYNLMSEESRAEVLRRIDADLAKQVRQLAAYEEESAGGIMTSAFLAVHEDSTVKAALQSVKEAEELETDVVYVIDHQGELKGFLTIQEILQEAESGQSIESIMDPKIFSVLVDADQEEVLRQASIYGLSTVPVIDHNKVLVGIVTNDDIVTVQEDEANEDIYRMAGTLAKDPIHLPTFTRLLMRLPMLIVTLVTCLFISKILAYLGEAEGGSKFAALKYLPLVIALAGNVGTIVFTIVVRGLATLNLEQGRLMKPLIDEMKVGLCFGGVSACLALVGIGFMEGWESPLGYSVALALLLSPAISGLAGFLIPVSADKLGKDPALMGPLVTNLIDLVGSAVYVMICLVLL